MRKIQVAVLIGLVIALAVTTGCQQRTERQGDTLPYTEPTTPSTGATNTANTYTVDLVPLNDSGVDGTATMTVSGNSITVEVEATGLEPNQEHLMHIHGFANQTPARLPAENSSVSAEQAEAVVGPPILPLSPFPTPDSSGRITFRGTFQNAQATFPLHVRALEIHGMTVNDAYDAVVPVAVGLLEPTRGRAQQQQQGPRTGTEPGVRGNAPTTGPNPYQPGMRQGTTTSP